MSSFDDYELERIRREFARKETMKQAEEFGFPYADLTRFTPCPEVLALVTRDLAVKWNVLPLKKVNGCLFFATADLHDMQAADAIRLACRCTIVPVVALREEIHGAIASYYPQEAQT